MIYVLSKPLGKRLLLWYPISGFYRVSGVNRSGLVPEGGRMMSPEEKARQLVNVALQKTKALWQSIFKNGFEGELQWPKR